MENNKATLFMQREGEDEFNPCVNIPELTFLGDTYTPAMTNTMQQFPSVDGSLYNFSTVGSNQIVVKFMLKYANYSQLKILRHKIFSLFMQKKMTRIRTDVEPYLVKEVYPTGFDIEPASDGDTTAMVTINYDNPSGYLFSMQRTDKRSKLWDNFSFAHVVDYNADDYSFTNEKSFTVYNDSDKRLDPYLDKDDIIIYIRFNGKSLKITNKTNGSTYFYQTSSDGSETIVVDGIVSKIGVDSTSIGNVATNRTDYNNLVLEEGDNNMQVTGADDFNIIFSFPFVYL